MSVWPQKVNSQCSKNHRLLNGFLKADIRAFKVGVRSSASVEFKHGAAKGGSWKDQPFVIGAANDGAEPFFLSMLQRSRIAVMVKRAEFSMRPAATAVVVPEPFEQSTTVSPQNECIRIVFSTRDSG